MFQPGGAVCIMVVRRTIKRYEWDSGTVSVCREREDSAETVEEDNMAVKTTGNPQREELKQKFVDRLQLECSVSPDEASDKQIYQVLSALMVEKLKHKRQHFVNKTNSVGGKSVYYLSMEFLMGRSLKTTLYNLELADDVRAILQDYHINLDNIFECEPDAGLGNGGLGRLAAGRQRLAGSEAGRGDRSTLRGQCPGILAGFLPLHLPCQLQHCYRHPV